MEMLIAGDWVLYPMKNEIGLVRSAALPGENVRVWLHTGGTSASTPIDFVERIDKPSRASMYENGYALPSLEERRVRVLSGVGDVSDLIDGKSIRPAIRRRYGL